MTDVAAKLRAELDEAERKAWDALGRYKFQMFGYWAAIWVHLNRIGNFKRANPWKSLVLQARAVREDDCDGVAILTHEGSGILSTSRTLPCDEQFAIATLIARNVGYVLEEEPSA